MIALSSSSRVKNSTFHFHRHMFTRRVSSSYYSLTTEASHAACHVKDFSQNIHKNTSADENEEHRLKNAWRSPFEESLLKNTVWRKPSEEYRLKKFWRCSRMEDKCHSFISCCTCQIREELKDIRTVVWQKCSSIMPEKAMTKTVSRCLSSLSWVRFLEGLSKARLLFYSVLTTPTLYQRKESHFLWLPFWPFLPTEETLMSCCRPRQLSPHSILPLFLESFLSLFPESLSSHSFLRPLSMTSKMMTT